MNSKVKKIILNNKLFQVLILANLLFEFVDLKIIAEENYLYNESDINHTNNFKEGDEVNLPSNPFELVEMIRRANSMNDATKPSDAIDEAIKSFDMINTKESL